MLGGPVMDWNKYFMKIAHTVAERSKDPNTKVGAVIVSPNRQIISTGYNGLPSGVDDNQLFWGDKQKYVIHAELNAVLFAKQDIEGCTIYCTHHPCCSCTNVLAQCGIKAVYYTAIPDAEKYGIDCAERVLDELRIFRKRLL